MTANGWIQILFFFAAILCGDRRRSECSCTGCWRARTTSCGGRSAGWSGSSTAWAAWTAASSPGRPTAGGLLAFSALTMLVTYAIQRLQHVLPFNPQDLAAVEAELGLQHRRQLHDEHELAGLRRRGHDELPEPDGGARLAQLHFGGGGHRRRDRPGPRPHPPRRRQGAGHDRQLLGRPDAGHRLHPAAAELSSSRSSSCRRG